MAEIKSGSIVKYSDIKKINTDFSFTRELAKIARNDNWTEGYNALQALIDSENAGNQYLSNEYLTLWKIIFNGTEDIGNSIYKSIKGYISDISDIDTCTYKSLKNFANTLKYSDPNISFDLSFPLEIGYLIDIFSVNKNYLFNKASLIDDTIDDTSSVSIIHSSTAQKIVSVIKKSNKTAYNKMIRDVFKELLMNMLSMKVGTYSDKSSPLDTDTEIWKTDTKRFTERLFEDDLVSSNNILKLKTLYGIPKGFTEKIHIDDIISGNIDSSNYTTEEYEILKAANEEYKYKYGNHPALKYFYIRYYKVLEYFRFMSILYAKIAEYNQYDINPNFLLIKKLSDAYITDNNYSYELRDDVITEIAEWLSDFCIKLSQVRESMKHQVQRNMLNGTKGYLIDAIKEFLLKNIDSETWKNLRSNTIFDACLNKNFDISVIEYVDTTEYFNIENSTDKLSDSDSVLFPKYWEVNKNTENSITKAEMVEFYNRLIDDAKRFDNNEHSDANLFEFLSDIFDAGATSNTLSDYNSKSISYSIDDNDNVIKNSESILDDRTKDIISKFGGLDTVSEMPYMNIKNSYHPSYQLHPFIQSFYEYNKAYSSISNFINSFSNSIEESIDKLSQRIDKFGNTINFWLNWNEDFSGYSSVYEKGGEDVDSKMNQTSPFNFDALESFLSSPEEFCIKIQNKTNKFYINDISSKFILTDAEIALEIQRLNFFKPSIEKISTYEIAKFGTDLFGNNYYLYKESGNRKNKNALGEIWIRTRNHPIAFPLFHIETKQQTYGFSNISEISSTDNEKLLSIVNTVISFYDDTYGYYNPSKSTYDGSVIANNFGIYFYNYENTQLLKFNKNKDNYELLTVDQESIDDYPIGETEFYKIVELDTASAVSTELMNSINFEERIAVPEDYQNSTYYTDTITGEIIPLGTTIIKNGVTSTEKSENPVIRDVSEHYLNAIIRDNKLTIDTNDKNHTYIVFADYTDTIEEKEDTIYTYKSNNTTYSCKKHKITLSNVFKLSKSRFLGLIQDNGDVKFDKFIIDTDGGLKKEPEYITISDLRSDSIEDIKVDESDFILPVDGSETSENFSDYIYYFKLDGKRYIANDSVNIKLKGRIILVGGNNPYYACSTDINGRPYYRDENGLVYAYDETSKHRGGKPTINLIRAYRSGVRTDVDNQFEIDLLENCSYIINDNNFYDDLVCSIKTFDINSCVFSRSIVKGNSIYKPYYDSITQFTLRDDPYVTYMPYTEISTPVISKEYLDTSKPYGTLTFYNTDSSNNITNSIITYYYNIEQRVDSTVPTAYTIMAKILTRNLIYQKISADIGRFSGSLTFNSSNSNNAPITLLFSNNLKNNIANYSAFYTTYNQQKFYDFGFSYDQKMMYMSYFDNDMDYSNSGVLFVSPSEYTNINGEVHRSLFKDNIHNIEFIDSSSMKKEIDITGGSISPIHLGDCVTKRGLVSMFGEFVNSEDGKILIIHATLISTLESRKFSYRIPIKFTPYTSWKDTTNGIYSTKLVATEKRLYLVYAANKPENDEYVYNSLNGYNTSSIGKTEFKNVISDDDNMIVILSFDIQSDELEYMINEDRYILRSGHIGYFKQFGGLSGRSILYTNKSLAYDNRFPFEIMFDDGGNIVNLVDNITVKSDDYSEFERFIDIHHDNNTLLDGFAISTDHDKAVRVKINNDKSSVISKITLDDNSIYDISRGGITNKHIIAINKSSEYANIIEQKNNDIEQENADIEHENNGFDSYKIPILGKYNKLLKTDFKELYDINKTSNDVYAIHSDNKTVSLICIEQRYATDTIIENGINTISGDSQISGLQKDELPLVGFYNVRTWYGKYITALVNNSETINAVYLKYENGNIIVINKIAIEDYIEDAIEPLPFIVEVVDAEDCVYGVPCLCYKTSKTITQSQSYKKLYFVCENSNSFNKEYAQFVYINNSEYGNFKDSFVRHITDMFHIEQDDRFILTSDSGVVYYTSFEIIKEQVDGQNIKRINILTTSLIDKNNKVLFNTKSFDLLEKDIIDYKNLNSIKNFEINPTVTTEKDGIILFRYINHKTNANGVIWTSTGSYSSSCDKCKFYFDNIEVSLPNISKIYAVSKNNGIILAQTDDNTYLYISTDNGKTFNNISYNILHSFDLCGSDNKYIYSIIDNDGICKTSDGYTWEKVPNYCFGKWYVAGINNKTITICNEKNENIDKIDKDFILRIKEQYTLNIDDRYTIDKLSLFEHNGDVELYAVSNIQGDYPLTITKLDSGDLSHKFTKEFKNINGIRFSDSYVYNNSMYFAPDGSSLVAVINNLDNEKEISANIVDISNIVNNELLSFKGFKILHDSLLLMIPKHGNRILAFDNEQNTFYNYYVFKNDVDICDVDIIDYKGSNEILMTPSKTSYNGEIDFNITSSSVNENINSFGIIEIDIGFPICVTYSKHYTDSDSVIYKIVFTMMNDYNKSVTIYTLPDELRQNEENYNNNYKHFTKSSIVYSIENKSLIYHFETVDENPRFVITKNLPNGDNSQSSDYLTVTYNLFNDSAITYKGKGVIYYGYGDDGKSYEILSNKDEDSVYKLSNSTFTQDILDSIVRITSNNENPLTKLIFNDKNIIDSNLKLNNLTGIESYANMFEGCSNALMQSSLTIPSTVTSTEAMFKDCTSALLTCVKFEVTKSEDSSTNETDEKFATDYMFYNCINAKLDEINIPESITSMTHMFENCKSATFRDVQTINIPSQVESTAYSFRNCFKLSVNNISFENAKKLTDCSYMFDNCESLNNITLKDINTTPITNATHMFYNAGVANSSLNNKTLSLPYLVDGSGMFKASKFTFASTEITLCEETESENVDLNGMFKNIKYMSKSLPLKLTILYKGNINCDEMFMGSNLFTLNHINISGDSSLSIKRMFKNCNELTDIHSIMLRPNHADEAFANCSKLDADISEFDYSKIETCRNMFNNTTIHSSKDDFDISNIVNGIEGRVGSDSLLQNIQGMFNSIPMIACHDRISNLKSVKYDISFISSSGRAIKYASNIPDYSETPKIDGDGNIIDNTQSKFSISGSITRALFPDGLLRYGGELKSDNYKYFYVIYLPVKSEGETIALKPISPLENEIFAPFNFNKYFNTNPMSDKENDIKQSYNTYINGQLYYSAIFNKDGSFDKFAFVGEYDRVHHFFIPRYNNVTGENDNSEEVEYYHMSACPFIGNTEKYKYINEMFDFGKWQNTKY